LKQLTDYIVDSRGVSNISLSVGNDDEQFIVRSGNIDIHSGHIMLKDQVEALRNIELKGIFTDNRFMIQRSTFDMGNGSIYLNNVFDPEPTDHFVLGFLDLGYFRVMIDQPGIQATIPVIAPPKTLSNIALKGQNSRYATVKGPFDDMKIEAYVTASNLDILFPPGADNLLNLILSVRSTGKKPDTDPVPLPFQMDLFVNIGENVRYVTYPTNLSLQPGGFLHLLYDGNAFIVKEVFISSERGTVDFFGTVFQVDNIAISMIDQQDIMNVEGHFYKRTPDGSTVSLNVRSTPEFDKSLLDRLEISLTSDNPADRNITQVLSRLRYNQSMDELPDEQKQNLLQDEALGLIGGNLNSTVLTPIFYPVENWIRRTLALDSFSINAGFIQNLFTEYSSDPSSLADMADLSNLTNDINRFSSSILLNNLSISMSKYLGYRFFVDYELGLQEATDLQKKTRLMVSHDTSLRLVLPKQYRVGYTFSYEPSEERITHEIMIQKTLRFWGL
ncbi:MAG: translocation/assembly module TamB domain-containing protein, partial [Candidatus Cloacimonetes bacterium]|nr:translocation/assembly module TamB domain-containing protein [Candidatus Cloacimonadota bacterium]